MGKRDRPSPGSSADSSQPANSFTAPSATFDVALASLFATSVCEKASCYFVLANDNSLDLSELQAFVRLLIA